VFVCSPSTVRTANGSGSLNTSRLDRPSAATTGTNCQREKVTTERCIPVTLIFLRLWELMRMNYEYNMEAYRGPEVAVIAPGINWEENGNDHEMNTR